MNKTAELEQKNVHDLIVEGIDGVLAKRRLRRVSSAQAKNQRLLNDGYLLEQEDEELISTSCPRNGGRPLRYQFLPLQNCFKGCIPMEKAL